MQRGPTFAERDRIEASRQAKRRECVERLARILVEEFDFYELQFVQGFEFDSIRTESYEIARTEALARLEAKK